MYAVRWRVGGEEVQQIANSLETGKRSKPRHFVILHVKVDV